jgi:ubiquinone/menaquinone biosynthesis C-methylase UbiE
MSNWNVLAKLDPLWTILSDPQKKFGGWKPEEFFATGEEEAKRVLGMCDSHGVKISYGRFLDFGCGVGRMTRAFSTYFTSCTGIDVSENMVSLARDYNRERTHCDFVSSQSTALPFSDGSFDFVFSVLVLQHLPTRSMILGFIGEFVRVAKENGVIVFQVPINVPLRRRIQLRRRLWTVLSFLAVPKSWLFKAGLAPIQINGVSQQQVEGVATSKGARVQAVERYDATEGEFHSYYYFIVKQAASPANNK